MRILSLPCHSQTTVTDRVRTIMDMEIRGASFTSATRSCDPGKPRVVDPTRGVLIFRMELAARAKFGARANKPGKQALFWKLGYIMQINLTVLISLLVENFMLTAFDCDTSEEVYHSWENAKRKMWQAAQEKKSRPWERFRIVQQILVTNSHRGNKLDDCELKEFRFSIKFSKINCHGNLKTWRDYY